MALRSMLVCSRPPFSQCHAATIAEVPGGLVCAFFAGTREGNPDVGIWLARRTGETWRDVREVATGVTDDGRRLPCWNPVLFRSPEGPLLLFYKVGVDPASWWGMLIESQDDGHTWNTARRLPDGIWGPIKNKPILLANGSLLCPTSGEATGWQVFLQSTPDWGRSWETIGPLNNAARIEAIQPTILSYRSGRLQLLCRTRQGHVSSCWSEDGGRTWSPMALIGLPNPNSGIDGCVLRDGRALLVYNHTGMADGRWGGPRSPLNVAASDDGHSWSAAAVLEAEAGEYSYPAVIQSKEGHVHIVYTWRRQNVKHVILDPARLDPQPMPAAQWPDDRRSAKTTGQLESTWTDQPY
jgi:predicted neuraminidase